MRKLNKLWIILVKYLLTLNLISADIMTFRSKGNKFNMS